MRPRPPVAGLAPSALLLACVLVGPVSAASPIPFVQPAAPRDVRSMLPPAIASGPRMAPSLAAGDPSDGTWQEHNLLQVAYTFTVHDQAHDQLLSLGGYQRTDHWALPLAGPPQWQPLPVPTSPLYLTYYSSVQDPATGLVYSLFPGPAAPEIRTLDPQTGAVATIPSSGTPPWWVFGGLVLDSVNQRLLVFGTIDPSFPAEVWALDLLPTPTWSQWTPSGPQAPNYVSRDAVVDPVRRRVVYPASIYDGPGSPWITALTLDGPPQWLRFATNGLSDGSTHNPTAYDPVSDRLWTINGEGEPYSLSLETFQWSHVPALGPGPSPRSSAGIAIDPVRHRLLVSGGWTPSGDDTHSDTWALSLDGSPAWTQLVPDAIRPPIRGGAGDGYDTSRHRMVVFGGADEHGGFRNDTWGLNLSLIPTWSPLATQGPLPPARYWHASAWDEAHDRFVVYGGFNGDSALLGDVWALSFAGGAPTWSPIVPAGPAPPARSLSQMVYDSARDRFLLMFGEHYSQLLDDVWELRLSPTLAWRQLAPAGVPPAARAAQMCVYEPAMDRVLVFGGGNLNGLLNDLWALNLASGDGAWQLLPVPPGPSPRNLGLLRMDGNHNRLVLFGGYGVHHYEGGNTYIEYLNDTWALNLTGTPAWQPLSPAGFLPLGRDRANGAYDPIHDRFVLACGGGSGSNDLWTLNFTDGPTPTLLDLAAREVTADRVRLVWAGAEPGMRATVYRREPGTEWRSLADLLADGEGHVTLEDRGVTPGATLEYRLGVMTGQGEAFFGATWVEIPRRALSLSARAVDGRAAFTVELASGEPATLVLFDVAGRSVWSRAVGHLGAGSHEVSAGDATLPAALYFARLTQGEVSRFARFAVMR